MDSTATKVQYVLDVAQGIQDYGLSTLICAIFLIMSAILMISCFLWFKSIVKKIMDGHSNQLLNMDASLRQNTEVLNDIAESIRPYYMLQIKTLSNTFMDWSMLNTKRLVERLVVENNIENKEATDAKIDLLVNNLLEDLSTKLELYTYKGKKLSSMMDIPKWSKRIKEVITSEIYHDNGFNINRAYSNIKIIYDNIKLDFYHNLNPKDARYENLL